MKRLFVIGALLLVTCSSQGQLNAAFFQGRGIATLQITGISSRPDGFVISIDPLQQDPDFNILENTDAMGSGNFDAEAVARALLIAANPLNVQVGDTLAVEAAARGAANAPGPSAAESFAINSIGISMINQSAVDVVVDFLLSYELAVEAGVGDPAFETADAFADVAISTGITGGFPLIDPFADAVEVTAPGDDPQLLQATHSFSFPVPASAIGSVALSTAAIGEAGLDEMPDGGDPNGGGGDPNGSGGEPDGGGNAIPEPASLLVWLLIAVCVGGLSTWRRRSHMF